MHSSGAEDGDYCDSVDTVLRDASGSVVLMTVVTMILLMLRIRLMLLFRVLLVLLELRVLVLMVFFMLFPVIRDVLGFVVLLGLIIVRSWFSSISACGSSAVPGFPRCPQI